MYRLICLVVMLSMVMPLIGMMQISTISTPAGLESPTFSAGGEHDWTRAKSWTTGGCGFPSDSQRLESQAFANRGSFPTERAGFEPAVNFRPHSISSAAQSAALSPLLVI